MALGIDKSALLTLILEAALWGFSVMMFGMTLYLLCRGRSSQDINYWNVVRACLLFIGSTVHIVANIARVVNAFTIDAARFGGPIGYLALLHRESIFMCAAYCFQTLLGDAIVIHRCYVAWQSIWVVIVPMIIWIGTAGSLMGMLHSVIVMSAREQLKLAPSLGFFMVLGFSLTLGCNLLATGMSCLLAYRIYNVNRELTRLRTNVMNSIIYPVMRTAIDAGVLYTFLLAGAIINKTKSTDPFVLTSIIVPCISIIFYMVIMRIAAAQASNRSSMSRPTFFQSRPASRSSKSKPPQLAAVEIYVSQSKTTDAKELESNVTDERSSVG